MLENTINFLNKLCQNNFIIYFSSMFSGRHSLEHVKLGSSGVKEKQEQLLLSTKQLMESHLHRGQVLGKEKKKSQKFAPKFLQEKNFYEPTLNIFSQKSKNKNVAYSSTLPRVTTAGCPEMLLCAS